MTMLGERVRLQHTKKRWHPVHRSGSFPFLKKRGLLKRTKPAPIQLNLEAINRGGNNAHKF